MPLERHEALRPHQVAAAPEPRARVECGSAQRSQAVRERSHLPCSLPCQCGVRPPVGPLVASACALIWPGVHQADPRPLRLRCQEGGSFRAPALPRNLHIGRESTQLTGQAWPLSELRHALCGRGAQHAVGPAQRRALIYTRAASTLTAQAFIRCVLRGARETIREQRAVCCAERARPSVSSALRLTACHHSFGALALRRQDAGSSRTLYVPCQETACCGCVRRSCAVGCARL
jgi:hypothetical protein